MSILEAASFYPLQFIYCQHEKSIIDPFMRSFKNRSSPEVFKHAKQA